MASAERSTAPAASPKQGRLPDFFIVGHPKSGTTALYQMLKRHPQIYMPDIKEPWFFVPELRARNDRGNSARHPRSLEGYLALFAGAGPQQTVGEATPSYLFSQTAARRIAELQPSARIVAVLREPASFLRSLHLQFLRTDVETEKSLRKAIELDGRRREGKSLPRTSTRPQTLIYSDHVRYAEQLRRYHEVFPREQVLVLIYDEFRADNLGTVRRILRFLELDDIQEIEPTEINPSVEMRSARVHSLVRALYLGRGPAARVTKRTIKRLLPARARRSLLAREHRAQTIEASPPDELLMLELRRRFKGEVAALSEYLECDLLTRWGYDDLG
jgi:hypothetical protein